MKIIIKPSNLFDKILLNYKCKSGTVDNSNKCDDSKGGQVSDAKEADYIGFKASQDFGFKTPRNKEFNSKVQAALDRAAEPLKKFSSEEKDVLRHYTGNGHATINERLANKPKNSSMNDMMNNMTTDTLINRLDQLFKNSELKDNIVAFRGLKNTILNDNPDLRNALDNPGTEIEFKCFSSSSALPFQAAKFVEGWDPTMSVKMPENNGRLIELKLPKGTKALFIAEESGIPSEFEILINRGTKFRVRESREEKIIPVHGEPMNLKVTTLEALV